MKIYISDSLISEALIMMHTMKQNKCYSLTEIQSINTYYGINKTTALELASQCQWIYLKEGITYEFTSLGENLLDRFDEMQLRIDLYRDILKNYILTCKPIWARRIPYGRNEAYNIMSDEEKGCFRKAGLMNSPVSREEVDWWDSFAKSESQDFAHPTLDIGRKGEELTIQFETRRTDSCPKWESIESNLSGYDIRSRVSNDNPSDIYIEVKSSTQNIKEATFFITYNEWKKASSIIDQNKYFFYLWVLEKKPKLAIISCFDMLKHIPLNNGSGMWVEVRVPFSAFEDCFQDVDYLAVVSRK